MRKSSTNPCIHPVVLSGGSGSRLWPLSRAAYPKQLLRLAGEHTMLQSTLLRAASIAGATKPLLVCNADHRFLIRDQCAEIECEPEAIVLEPVGRNTAPAIALAAYHLREKDPDALMLVLAADHVVADVDGFANTVANALPAAQAGYLVTFGIPPTSPETGYGYIKLGNPLPGCHGTSAVDRFVEKPDRETAEHYVSEGGHLWNSGMFLFSARRYLEELHTHRPDIAQAARLAWEKTHVDLGFLRPGADEFAACPSESIDYAVMQSTRQAAVVLARFDWSDVGSWDSLWQITERDVHGNAAMGDTYLLDTRNSYVNAQGRLVAVVGLDDVVVVETADALLVMHRSKAQQVKQVVAHIESRGSKEHLEHRRVYRPWGWYEGIAEGARFQVKQIMVEPGQKISLQMHHHRTEHWIVVSGTARVTLEDQVTLLSENQSTYIPLGSRHRLENPGKVPLQLIEVQSGSYLGEDDIVRFDDLYGRSEPQE